MSEDILKTIKGLLASGKGNSKRLREIIEVIKKGEPIVMSDYRYIQTLTESSSVEGEKPTNVNPSKKDESLELLRVRLAEGQITVEQFRELKKALTEDE
ncbi:MAG: hypothetical protein D4R90_01190 [Nitrosopumilales archaeon]|nr:MAG: hypothetical protein D4R90_01190 [Nitrosopumilales archaeon]